MRKKARLFYFNKNFGPLGALVGEEHAATVSWLLNIVLSSRTGYGVSKINYLTVRPELSRRAPLGFSQSLAVEMTQAVNRDVSGIAQSATGRIKGGVLGSTFVVFSVSPPSQSSPIGACVAMCCSLFDARKSPLAPLFKEG
jgi:hypothetical protein